MNAKALFQILVASVMGLVAVQGAEAKGSGLSIGLTVVSSCATSGANVYSAIASNDPATLHSGVTMKAGCTSDMSYTVSVSSDARSRSDAGRTATSSREIGDAGDIVVTLTY